MNKINKIVGIFKINKILKNLSLKIILIQETIRIRTKKKKNHKQMEKIPFKIKAKMRNQLKIQAIMKMNQTKKFKMIFKNKKTIRLNYDDSLNYQQIE